MDRNTIMFDAFKTQKSNKQILNEVYNALEEKDYNPIDQLVGYLISGDPSYITSYNNARTLIKGIDRDELIAEMIRRGYTYYDWNAASGDASRPYVSPKTIRDNVLNNNTNMKKKILLMHDGKGHSTTAEALPEIIEGLVEQGYEFRALDNSVSPICFGY